MAQLVGICRDDDGENFQKHQLPVYVDDMRTMIVEFDDPCRGYNSTSSAATSNMSFKQFRQKMDSLKPEELVASLNVECEQFTTLLSQLIICVGCRRSVEKLYTDLANMGHLAVHPLVINRNCALTVHRSVLLEPKLLHKLLIGDGKKVRSVLDNLTKCRKNKRCSLHSLDTHVCKAKVSWEELWCLMSEDCRDECCVVESESLLDMLETYLQKHKFCTECRTKVMKAYYLLIGDGDSSQEKGFNPSLYQGLRYCPSEQHLHLKPSASYLNMLIERAEPELLGRERHAKTLDVAQGEVLTCLGLYMYDRLHRLAMALKTLQITFQLLYCTGVIALHTSFQEMLEMKHGLSDSLERLCAELQDSAANPSIKNAKLLNGASLNKKTKKKTIKNQTIPNNEKVELPKASTEEDDDDDSCHGCHRRKARLNLTPSHSPLRSTRLSKHTRSLSPRSPSENMGHCCGSDVVENNDAFVSSKVVIDRFAEISNSTTLGIKGFSSKIDATITPRVVETFNDAGYCSQELSPDGGSPHNKFHSNGLSSLTSSYLKSELKETSCCTNEKEKLHQDSVQWINNRTVDHHENPCVCTLTDLLAETDEIDECETCGDDQSIAPEDIEWFHRNQSQVLEERRALREKLLRQFENMQARMVLAASQHPTV